MIPTIELYGRLFAEKMMVDQDMRIVNKMERDACFIYLKNGRSEVYSPNEKITLTKGEAILMKCGNYVGCAYEGTPMNPFESVAVHMDPEMIKRAFSDKTLDELVEESKANQPESAVKIPKNFLLDEFVKSLEVYFDHPELVNDHIMSVKLQELVVILIQEKNEMVYYLLNNLYKKVDYEFEEVVQNNVFNRLSVPEIASLTNRSESTFKRDFKKYFGESPAKWIKKKRLEKAKELLLNSNLTVSEITWDTGFENPSHFSTSFVKEFGQSPRNYRLTETEKSLS
jgi:AraC-like DNA-binding protein